MGSVTKHLSRIEPCYTTGVSSKLQSRFKRNSQRIYPYIGLNENSLMINATNILEIFLTVIVGVEDYVCDESQRPKTVTDMTCG